MKRPRCGLLNTETAQRCDCGYDFESQTIQKAYFKQELPREIRTYMIVLVILNLLAGIGVLASGDVETLVGAVVWSGLVWALYAQLVRKKNWARLTLVFFTFPFGLLLGLSQEAKLYCLQK
jgi:hypothetical protein